MKFGGKIVWNCIRAMQYGRRGLVPSRASCIRDEDGNHCLSLSEQQQRWQRHFTKVLNVRSVFDVSELEKTRQRPPRLELAEKPTMTELTAAVKKTEEREGRRQLGHSTRDGEGWMLQRRVLDSSAGSCAHGMGESESA